MMEKVPLIGSVDTVFAARAENAKKGAETLKGVLKRLTRGQEGAENYERMVELWEVIPKREK